MKSIRERALFEAYRLAGQSSTPFLRAQMERQARQGMADPERLPERFGFASEARPEGALIWMHAGHADDLRSLLPMARLIIAQGISVVLTTSSLSAFQRVVKEVPSGASLQYSPVDVERSVTRFLDHWKPDLMIVCGGDFWPVTIRTVKSRGISILAVSAGLPADFESFWRRRIKLAMPMFEALDFVAARTEAEALAFRELGCGVVNVCGDLKYDMPPKGSVDQFPSERDHLHHALEGRNAWMSVALTEAELDLSLQAQSQILDNGGHFALILVPGKTHTLDFVKAKIEVHGLSHATLGDEDRPGIGAKVIIINDTGLIDLAYEVCGTSYLGASHGPDALGGKSPVDAILNRCVVVSGKTVHRHPEIYTQLYKAKAAAFVSDADVLGRFVMQSLHDEVSPRRARDNAEKVLAELRGSLNRTYMSLDPYLRPICYRARMELALPLNS